jgi:toxin YoeB
MRNIEFVPKAFGEFRRWIEEDRKIAIKITELIKDIDRNPFVGIGKPEPLKNKYSGFWSRRITDEHRLVYKFTETTITIFSCYSHYGSK